MSASLPQKGDSVGSQYTNDVTGITYEWTGSYWKVAGSNKVGTGVIIDSDEPGFADDGTFWYQPTTGRLYVYVGSRGGWTPAAADVPTQVLAERNEEDIDRLEVISFGIQDSIEAGKVTEVVEAEVGVLQNEVELLDREIAGITSRKQRGFWTLGFTASQSGLFYMNSFEWPNVTSVAVNKIDENGATHDLTHWGENDRLEVVDLAKENYAVFILGEVIEEGYTFKKFAVTQVIKYKGTPFPTDKYDLILMEAGGYLIETLDERYLNTYQDQQFDHEFVFTLPPKIKGIQADNMYGSVFFGIEGDDQKPTELYYNGGITQDFSLVNKAYVDSVAGGTGGGGSVDGDFVTLDTEQTITGRKVFLNGVDIEAGNRDDVVKIKDNEDNLLWEIRDDGNIYGHTGVGLDVSHNKTVRLDCKNNYIKAHTIRADNELTASILTVSGHSNLKGTTTTDGVTVGFGNEMVRIAPGEGIALYNNADTVWSIDELGEATFTAGYIHGSLRVRQGYFIIEDEDGLTLTDIKPDGSITCGGDIVVHGSGLFGSDVTLPARPAGVAVLNSGAVVAARASGQSVFVGFAEGTDNATSYIHSDGQAYFAKGIKLGGDDDTSIEQGLIGGPTFGGPILVSNSGAVQLSMDKTAAGDLDHRSHGIEITFADGSIGRSNASTCYGLALTSPGTLSTERADQMFLGFTSNVQVTSSVYSAHCYFGDVTSSTGVTSLASVYYANAKSDNPLAYNFYAAGDAPNYFKGNFTTEGKNVFKGNTTFATEAINPVTAPEVGVAVRTAGNFLTNIGDADSPHQFRRNTDGDLIRFHHNNTAEVGAIAVNETNISIRGLAALQFADGTTQASAGPSVMYGSVGADGTGRDLSSGIQYVLKQDTGKYKIGFTNAKANSFYAVSAIIAETGTASTTAQCQIESKGTGSFVVLTIDSGNGNTRVDKEFSFVVYS